MILLESAQELPLRRLAGTTPQFSQHYSRCADETGHRLDPLLMTPGAQMIDKDRGIEDDDFTHRGPRTRAFLRISS